MKKLIFISILFLGTLTNGFSQPQDFEEQDPGGSSGGTTAISKQKVVQNDVLKVVILYTKTITENSSQDIIDISYALDYGYYIILNDNYFITTPPTFVQVGNSVNFGMEAQSEPDPMGFVQICSLSGPVVMD